MKNNILLIFIAIITINSSCKKDEIDTSISYPALYVVNGTSNNLSVIELSTNSVKRTINLNNAPYPHHVSLSPDKKYIAVAIAGIDLSAGHSGHGTGGVTKVMILDAVTGEIHHEIGLLHLPHNAAFSPSGTELWIPQADTIQGTVFVYNTSSYAFINTINVGKSPSEISFSFDGSMAFVANTMDGTVTMVDPVSKAIMATITVGEDPVGAWPAPNGKMYVDNETSMTISEIDVATASVISTINLGFMPAYVAYSTHHSELWISDATNGKIAFFENMAGVWTPAGSLTTGTNAHAIVFNKEGTIAYVSNQGANTISVIDVVNHAKLQDISVGNKPNGMAIKD